MDLSEVSTSTSCRHPWESVRFRFFRDRLRDAGVLDRPVRVLDVGAGDGWFAARLLDLVPHPSRPASPPDRAGTPPARRAGAPRHDLGSWRGVLR